MMSDNTSSWKKINNKSDLPLVPGRYFTTDKYGHVCIENYFPKVKIGFTSSDHWLKHYIAWMTIDLPQPYKEL